MARRRRLQFPGAVYHVMSRGNRKAAVFEDDGDRAAYLRTLARAVTRYGIRCLGYCLMGNHYHLVIDTPRGNLSDAMHYINGVYAQYSNRRHERTGHLWERRFRSLVVQREGYLRRASRYVVLNPVRGGLATAAEDWPWSSYRATAGLTTPPRWLHVDWIQMAFDTKEHTQAQELYRAFVNDPAAKESRINVRAVSHGDPHFEAALNEIVRKTTSDRLLPRFAMDLTRPPLADVLQAAATRGPGRDRAIAIAHVTYGYRQTEIAAFLRLHQSSVSRALRRIGGAE